MKLDKRFKPIEPSSFSGHPFRALCSIVAMVGGAGLALVYSPMSPWLPWKENNVFLVFAGMAFLILGFGVLTDMVAEDINNFRPENY